MVSEQSALAQEVERRLQEDAELFIAVSEDEGRLILTGLLSTEREREVALEVVRDVAPNIEVDDNLEIGGVLPGGLGTLGRPAAAIELPQTEAGERTLEPGDFTDQETIRFGEAAAGATSAFEEDEAGSGSEVYVPPIDPVGTDREVIGGLQESSMEDIDVAPSALDGALGDEAIREAILRELREDAQTRDLDLDVQVEQGRVVLRGHVLFIEDVDGAEEVTSRVPGVVEVEEELEVDGL